MEIFIWTVIPPIYFYNTICFIGIQGSPNCSIYWGKHKTNKYHTESIVEDASKKKEKAIYGVMTTVLDNMLKENNIHIPYFEAPVKESLDSELVKKFFNDLDNLLNIPEDCRFKINLDLYKNKKEWYKWHCKMYMVTPYLRK